MGHARETQFLLVFSNKVHVDSICKLKIRYVKSTFSSDVFLPKRVALLRLSGVLELCTDEIFVGRQKIETSYSLLRRDGKRRELVRTAQKIGL